jgi:Tfp pilus assembly protein PilO
MPRSFNLPQLKWKDPRVAIRAVLGALLLANLVAAVLAFKPFGGGADDLRAQRGRLQQQLAQLNAQVAHSKRMAVKVQTARTEGDHFLEEYVTDRRVLTSTVQSELVQVAKEAGITLLSTNLSIDPIEGSDTLSMMTISAGCTGTYAGLAKFVNLVDKSDRFLIIESMVAVPQQSGPNINVTLKIDMFTNERGGDGL